MEIKKEVVFITGFVIALALLQKKINKNEEHMNASGKKRKEKKGIGQEEEDDTITTPFPEMETHPIGSFQLCCLWGCDDCGWTWGGGGQWVNNTTGRIHIHRR
jgi:hypothetical protein